MVYSTVSFGQTELSEQEQREGTVLSVVEWLVGVSGEVLRVLRVTSSPHICQQSESATNKRSRKQRLKNQRVSPFFYMNIPGEVPSGQVYVALRDVWSDRKSGGHRLEDMNRGDKERLRVQ